MRSPPWLYMLVGLALGAGSLARAAQWSIVPEVSWLVDYSSNLLLVPMGQAIGGTTLSLDSIFKRETDITEFDLHPHLDLERFDRDTALDANEGSLSGLFSAHSERSSISLTSGYERASTLTTELSDTGIVDANTNRETTSASLALGHDLAERQHLDLLGTYADVIYPDGERVGLVGYRYPQLSLTDTFTLAERTSLSASVLADELRAPLTGYQSHDLSANLGWSRTLSELVKVSLAGGVVQTSASGETQHGYLWDAHTTRNSELTRWDVDYSRSVQPSGSGFLIRRDALNLSVAQNIAPRLFATLSAQDIRNENLAGGAFDGVPRYLSCDGGLEWHLSLQLVLNATGGLAENRQPVTDLLVRGWRGAVTLHWLPRPLSVSR